MTSPMLLMDIETERKFATDELRVFAVRYHEFGDDYPPLQVALRWQRAIRADPVDFSVLQGIFDEVKDRRKDFDICFFAFSNHMESVLKEAWHDSFRQGGNP